MSLIKIKAGLDIPMKGFPSEDRGVIGPSCSVGIDLSSFDCVKLKLLKRVGDTVSMGEVVAYDKEVQKRKWISFSAGVVKEIVRGERRRPLTLVIERSDERSAFERVNVASKSREELLHLMSERGCFPFIRKRPCSQIADPAQPPRSIFIQGIESAPFMPPAELHVKGKEESFRVGLALLEKIGCGNVHMVMRSDSELNQYCDNVTVHAHVGIGPHPIANPSIHIEKIDPITSSEDVIWTLHVADVIVLGSLMMGEIDAERLIAIAGEGIDEKVRGFYRVHVGESISHLIQSNEIKGRILSGSPIDGSEVKSDGFLGLQHYALSILPHSEKRSFFHFCQLGFKRYTSSRTYFSKLLSKLFSFSTQLHGELRPFVDGVYYDKVMPLSVPTMPLLKALLAEDFELAVQLGLLEVSSEDFALTSFVCPSKIDHMSIVKKGLDHYASLYIT